MTNKYAKLFLLLHAVLLTWAALFFVSLFYIHDGGKTAGTLAIGNLAFLLVNIPLSAVCIILAAKKRFTKPCSVPIVIMSILNAAVGINAWAFLIMLMEEYS